MCPKRLQQGSTQRGIWNVIVALAGYYVLRTEGLEAANEFVLFGVATLGALGIINHD